MFCFHKFDKLNSDNIQYCKKCGVARELNKKCDHIWNMLQTYELSYRDQVKEIRFVQQCTKCGVLNEESTSL